MAYQSNRFIRTAGGLSNSGYNEWLLDTTDTLATVNTDGYVSDGATKGANVGDFVKVRVWSALPTGSGPIDAAATVTAFQLMVVASKGATSIDLTDGTAVSLTDTD